MEENIENNVEEEEGLDEAKEVIANLTRQNEIMTKNLTRQEHLAKVNEQMAKAKAVSGEAKAGQPSEQKEETPKEYAKRVMTGEI